MSSSLQLPTVNLIRSRRAQSSFSLPKTGDSRVRATSTAVVRAGDGDGRKQEPTFESITHRKRLRMLSRHDGAATSLFTAQSRVDIYCTHLSALQNGTLDRRSSPPRPQSMRFQ